MIPKMVNEQFKFIYGKIFQNQNTMIKYCDTDFTWGEARFVLGNFAEIDDICHPIKEVIIEQIKQDVHDESIKA